MEDNTEVFVGIDVAKLRNAVAVADGGRNGEIRYLGEFDADEASMRRVVKRLADKHERIMFCYEAGPTGYGLYRLIRSMGHECIVVAPSLIPRRPGDQVKTNRRDALGLARLLRAGELTSVWVPDESHEAMRDLVRARTAAVETQRVHRQHITSFMLKHGRVFPRKKHWSMRYMRWLQEQHFEHPAHQIALQEMVEALWTCNGFVPVTYFTMPPWPRMWIDAAQLAVFDERGDHRPVVSAFVRPSEQGIFAIQGERPDAAFDGVAVEIDATVIEEP